MPARGEVAGCAPIKLDKTWCGQTPRPGGGRQTEALALPTTSALGKNTGLSIGTDGAEGPTADKEGVGSGPSGVLAGETPSRSVGSSFSCPLGGYYGPFIIAAAVLTTLCRRRGT